MKKPKEIKELNTKIFDLASDYISDTDELAEAFKKIKKVINDHYSSKTGFNSMS